jgi:hypothetical protein
VGTLPVDPLEPMDAGSPRWRRRHQDYSRRAIYLRLLVVSVLLIVIVGAGIAVVSKGSTPSGSTPGTTVQVPPASPVTVGWIVFSAHASDFLFHHVDIPGARKVLSDDLSASETAELVKIEISIDQEDQTNLANETSWLASHLPQTCFETNYQDYKAAISELKQATDLHLGWAQKYPNGDAADLSRADTLLGSAGSRIQRAVLAAPLADPHQPCASA